MSFLFRKKWKMHLYLNGICVGTKLIDEKEEPNKNIYVVHFWFKFPIFHSLHVKSVIHPTRILYTDETKKETHWLFEYEKGVDV